MFLCDSSMKLPFPLISTAKDLIVCYCHDKRLRISRILVRLFSTIFVVVLFFSFFSVKIAVSLYFSEILARQSKF